MYARRLYACAEGLLSPRSASSLCDKLGFHTELPHSPGELPQSPISREDFLSWIDTFMGQIMRDDELRLAQRYALLKSCDESSTGHSRKPPVRTRHVLAWPITWKDVADVRPMRQKEEKLVPSARKQVARMSKIMCAPIRSL